jgi:hypothetical protein
MPEPIAPLPSHAPSGSVTDPALAQSLFSQLRETEPLNDQDFAHLFTKSLESKANADKVRSFLESNNVSQPERAAFYEYVNSEARNATGMRREQSLATIGGVDISPEDVLLVGGGAMAAAKGAGAGLRMAKGAAAGAAPLIKYEVVKYGLEKVGLPSPLATVAAAALAARLRRGASAPAAATEAAVETTATEAITRPPAPAAPSGPRTINEAMAAAMERARTAKPPTVVKALNDVQAATTAAKVKLTAAETTRAMKLVREGATPSDALAAVVAQRQAPIDAAAAFAARYGTPTEAEVQQIVRAKNAQTTRAKGGPKE